MKKKKPKGDYKFTQKQASSFAKLKTIPDNINDVEEPENSCFCVPKEELKMWEAVLRGERKPPELPEIIARHKKIGLAKMFKGGAGSGNYGLAGRPGMVGGSTPVENFMKLLNTMGEFSQTVRGLIPKSGFMVSPYEDRQFVVKKELLTKEAISKYVKNNSDLLKKNYNYLGGWVDKGKVYLDISVRRESQGLAMTLAVQHNQEAIYDVVNKRSIDAR
jgi:hypothetical protein